LTQRQAAENQTDAKQGKMLFAEALKILRSRIEGDASLKPRSRGYYEQRLVALLKSWPALEQKDVRTITKSDCLDWAAKFARETCVTAFNNTVSVLRRALDIAVELGVRYDNPVAAIKRVSVRAKRLTLPGFSQFTEFVQAIESAGGRDSRNCAACPESPTTTCATRSPPAASKPASTSPLSAVGSATRTVVRWP